MEELKAKEKENEALLQKQKDRIKTCEESLKSKREKEETMRRTADALFLEATERLKKGVQNKNMEEIRIANVMLESVAKVRKEEEQERNQGNKILKTLKKRKSVVLENYFSKKPKNQ